MFFFLAFSAIFTLEHCCRELKYVHAQWRLSIYGRRLCEWDKLSRWFFVHKLSHSNVRERVVNDYKWLVCYGVVLE